MNKGPSNSFITSRNFRNNEILFSIRESHVAISCQRASILTSQPTCICFSLLLEGRSCFHLTRSSIIDILTMNVLTTFLYKFSSFHRSSCRYSLRAWILSTMTPTSTTISQASHIMSSLLSIFSATYLLNTNE
jgi:hypothetical protein